MGHARLPFQRLPPFPHAGPQLRRPEVVVAVEEAEGLRPVAVGRGRGLGRVVTGPALFPVEGQGLERQRLVPAVTQLAVHGRRTAVEVGGLPRTFHRTVRLARTVPRHRLPAAVAEAAVQRSGTLKRGQRLGVLPKGSLTVVPGLVDGQHPFGVAGGLFRTARLVPGVREIEQGRWIPSAEDRVRPSVYTT